MKNTWFSSISWKRCLLYTILLLGCSNRIEWKFEHTGLNHMLTITIIDGLTRMQSILINWSKKVYRWLITSYQIVSHKNITKYEQKWQIFCKTNLNQNWPNRLLQTSRTWSYLAKPEVTKWTRQTRADMDKTNPSIILKKVSNLQ